MANDEDPKAGHTVLEGSEQSVRAGMNGGRDTDPRLGQPPVDPKNARADREDTKKATPSGFTSSEVNEKSGGDPKRRG